MEKNTKIVATISDRKCDIDFLTKLYEEGMNVVRLNTAHQGHEDSLKVIRNVRKVSDKIAILLDTKGPEIRTTKVEEEFMLKRGDKIEIKGAPESLTHNTCIYVTYSGFVNDVPVGSKILIDDGSIELEVLSKENGALQCEAHNDGPIQSRKSVNVPGVSFQLPSLSQKDRDYVYFSIEHDVEFIAHSFVRNADDVLAIQKILDEKGSKIKIIAKIENQEGVDNIDSILDHAYGVMVARGDLAIEIPYEKIPGIQQMIIQKCIDRRKPVIVATQMLHSMIKNPRPTRAEVSDIAHAVFSNTDAIMLSGETAYGDYPVEAVQTMARVAREVEANKPPFNEIPKVVLSTEISSYLTRCAVKATRRLDTKAIVADSATGRTTRNIASYRGKNPVYAMCYDQRVMREMALSYGIFADYMAQSHDNHEFVYITLNKLMNEGKLKKEDLIVIVAGNFGVSHGSSFIEISTVSNMFNISAPKN